MYCKVIGNIALISGERLKRHSPRRPQNNPAAPLMPVSDLDIARSAHQWISLHGENATARAREMIEQMRKKGDKGDADVWLRIIVAISTLCVSLTKPRPPREPKTDVTLKSTI